MSALEGPSLHVRGHVVVGDDREVGDLWVKGGRVSLTRPSAQGTNMVELEGWVLPGLVDVHCHVGLGAQGAVDAATAQAQATADRDSGVLLVRDAGSPLDTRWVHGRRDLPRLVRAGRHLARPKRYLQHYGLELDHVGALGGRPGEADPPVLDPQVAHLAVVADDDVAADVQRGAFQRGHAAPG